MKTKIILIINHLIKILYAFLITIFIAHLLNGISLIDSVGIFAIVYLKEFITIKVEVKDE